MTNVIVEVAIHGRHMWYMLLKDMKLHEFRSDRENNEGCSKCMGFVAQILRVTFTRLARASLKVLERTDRTGPCHERFLAPVFFNAKISLNQRKEKSYNAVLIAVITSHGCRMEEPYSIASVPEPLDKDRGRIFTAPVYALSGSRKRKRREVAVGIDGESVNIYDVCKFEA